MATRRLTVQTDLAPQATLDGTREGVLAGGQAGAREETRPRGVYEPVVDQCREFLARDSGVHHLAHYTGGIWDFALHVLADPAVRALPGRAEGPDLRSGYRQAGRMLIFQVERVGDYLADLRSGTLVRTVVESGDCVAVYVSLRPQVALVGITLDPARVWEADRGMAELIAGIRERVRLPDEDLGGFRRNAVPAAHAMSADLLTVYGDAGVDPVIRRAARITAAEVGPLDLHYLAYYDDFSLKFSVDCLTHPDLADYFTDISPEARRAKYGEVGDRAGVLAGDFGHAVRLVSRSRPRRLVLDVQQGAVFVRWLDTGRHLVGVTLDQSMVAAAERRLDMLRPRFEELFPLPAGGVVPPGALTL
ncbi:hypothetical protein SAMN05421505_11448 [Sinosporangium album]|uniref:Uncharacterized protein n=1 Tax=Sinosporangium album TaxID=504805 RepID=A0A1G8BHH7_9ACTN|nr:hypothetical protein [Sinosporangium album]SDH32702.1 hypothetical protein SAMN05421505_11448 [Sinosporangium album]